MNNQSSAQPGLIQTPFWYLRHGETSWNVQGLAQGRSEIALNARGLVQAGIAAEALSGQGIATIVASPLLRARVTAETVGEKLGLQVRLHDGLVECAYGEKEGAPMHEWFTEWFEGRYTPAGAESFTDLRLRVVAALNDCLVLPGPVLVVAHGAVMRAVRAAMGQTVNVRTPNAAPLHCQPAGVANPWTITSLPIAEAPPA